MWRLAGVGRWGREERPDEVELDRRVEENGPEQERGSLERRHPVTWPQRFRGGAEQHGAIGRAGGGELLFEPLEQDGEVRAAEREPRQTVSLDQCKPELLKTARERTREARRPRDRC